MSAPTSPYGNQSGRASVPPAGRASARPSRPSGPGEDWPPRSGSGGGGARPPAGGSGNSYRGNRPRPRWRRIALLAGLALLIIAVIAGISLYGYARGLDKDLKRTDAFSGLSTDRPAKAIEGAQNILLVGS